MNDSRRVGPILVVFDISRTECGGPAFCALHVETLKAHANAAHRRNLISRPDKRSDNVREDLGD